MTEPQDLYNKKDIEGKTEGGKDETIYQISLKIFFDPSVRGLYPFKFRRIVST